MARSIIALFCAFLSVATATGEVPERPVPDVHDLLFPPDFKANPITPESLVWQKPWLSQEDTNGKSLLGTLDAPKLHSYVGSKEFGSGKAGVRGSSKLARPPWGSKAANGAVDPNDVPVTNQTRSYYLIAERGVKAPDGVSRNVMLLNGSYPGPTIEANWGDTIEVTIENRITGPEEGISLHWHGILHKGAPWEDGVPGVSQFPVAPGETFTYSFTADLYGTSWYHSHYSAQYADGLYGAMIIHGPNHVEYDEDLGPVLLSDTYFRDYWDLLEDILGTNITKLSSALFSDNNLIQGKGTYDCSLTTLPCARNGGYAKFHFESGKTYRMRLINSGADTMQHFSIDDHTMTVIANDFVPVVPYQTKTVALGIGQRTDILVTANSTLPAVWIRSTVSACSLAHQPNGLAVIYYDDTDTTSEPASTAWPPRSDPCANDALDLTVPLFPMPAPLTPDRTITIDVNTTVNATGNLVWTMNESTFRVNFNDPVMYRAIANDPNYTYPESWNIYPIGTSASSSSSQPETVRIIVNNYSPHGHPMHMHGHNYMVLSEGAGLWDETSITRIGNPQRRDTQMLLPADKDTKVPSHMVLQIQADNAGVWPFHCHIAWHVSGGLYVNLLENANELAKMGMPQHMMDLQGPWDAFTGEGPINVIDSGL
jgi:FtsP/CotA-like multicopper oxidase with cupredoxin domain